MNAEKAARLLKECGELTIMEVCGTHTAAIAKSGLHSLLPQNIRLVSGPGCPVCVTDAGFIDALIDYAGQNDACVLSFGDLFRVRGTRRSFAEAKAEGGDFRVIYSPLEAVALAERHPEKQFALAAVGFETTAPLYALALESIISGGIKNLRLCASLKRIIPAMDFICRQQAVNGFICPGHVSAVIGAGAYLPLLEQYGLPLVIAGFEPESIVAAICQIAAQARAHKPAVANLYGEVVTGGGNARALALLARYFEPGGAIWRGIGQIADSALVPRAEYSGYFIESAPADSAPRPGCRCADVLLGRISPRECALFGKACRPESPVGACMVSAEGACGIWYGVER